MKIETLKKSYLKRNLIIGIVAVLIISAIILNFTRAKYRVTQSIPLVNGTINYNLADLNIIGLYIDGEEAAELDSSKTYTLDATQSTCTYKDGTEIENLAITYDNETGELSISPYTAKGTKCTLYFNEQVFVRDVLLANYPTQLTRTNFSTTVTNTTTGTIYKSLDETQYDNDGEVYYFAGNPTDNWVYLGGFYWRIIRINGDGSIRLIYSGDSSSESIEKGTDTQIGTSAYNEQYDDNAYVGYMYGTSGSNSYNETHENKNDSTIKKKLDNWFKENLINYEYLIDENAGFCGDREVYMGFYSGHGYGKEETSYMGKKRIEIDINPSLKCTSSNDLYTQMSANNGNHKLTYPIGLITADEVAYAGGVYGTNNTSYYLYTGEYYWTMTPISFYSSSIAFVYLITDSIFSGGFFGYNWVNESYGVRPVINLRADVQLSGSGTASDPYTVVET